MVSTALYKPSDSEALATARACSSPAHRRRAPRRALAHIANCKHSAHCRNCATCAATREPCCQEPGAGSAAAHAARGLRTKSAKTTNGQDKVRERRQVTSRESARSGAPGAASCGPKRKAEVLAKRRLKIGIVGFGRFGQFLSTKFASYDHEIYGLSLSDRASEATKCGAKGCGRLDSSDDVEAFFERKPDVVVLACSIVSFEETLQRPTVTTKVSGNVVCRCPLGQGARSRSSAEAPPRGNGRALHAPDVWPRFREVWMGEPGLCV